MSPANGRYRQQAVYLGASDGEALAYEWTASKARAYPPSRYYAALQPPKRQEKPRRLYVCELVCDTWSNPSDPEPIGLVIADGETTEYTDLTGSPGPGALVPARIACLNARGSFLCFWNGAQFAFHVLLRKVAPTMVAAGWAILPIASGCDIKGLRLQLGRQEWFLVDAQSMVGAQAMRFEEFVATLGEGQHNGRLDCERLYRALVSLQSLMVGVFGVALRPTIGSMAMKVASQHMPVEPKWWRPHPLLVAACREGGAYRGGFTYAEQYEGPAWRVDANKLYTWALRGPLPARAALGRCLHGGQEREGIFLCQVEGAGDVPAYLAPWESHERGFRKQSRWAFRSLCWLPQAEFAGLRSLGYTVRPGIGWVFTDHISLAPFVDKLVQLQSTYPRGTAQHLVSKLLGNNVYGKLAERAERVDVAYSLAAPDAEWWPFLTTRNQIVPHLWTRAVTRHRPHQHIDAASVITARGRTAIYLWAGEWARRGGRLVHGDTDGLVLTSDPTGVMPLDDAALGAMRLDCGPVGCLVVGRKHYSLGSKVYCAGVSDVQTGTLALVMGGQSVTVNRQVLRSPWDSPAMYQAAPYSLRVTADTSQVRPSP